MLHENLINKIETTIGYTFNNKQLLAQAFTRSSYRSEHPEALDNEVMEFYGDSVLSLALSDLLFDRYCSESPEGIRSLKTEGDLSSLRSSLSNKQFLSDKMYPLSLQNYLNVSIGDTNQGIQNSASVLEDLFESIICAIFLDSGKSLKTVKTVISNLLGVDVYLNENEKNIQISYKNSVQEWCQKYGFHIPEYEIIQTAGGFVAVCKIEELGLVCESIECHKRKDAEKAAAKGMLEILYDIEPSVKNDIEMTYLLNKPITLSGANENNCKNALQEYCDKNKHPHPIYKCISETLNSDNSHTFTVICTFNGQSAEGSAPTKKGAEKEAAHNILKKLGFID